MPNYRKKPVLVEARQIETRGRNASELALWCRGKVREDGWPCVMVPTLEGELIARPGDYIVKGGKHGECWPVKGEIFEDTYTLDV